MSYFNISKPRLSSGILTIEGTVSYGNLWLWRAMRSGTQTEKRLVAYRLEPATQPVPATPIQLLPNTFDVA